MEDGNAPRFTPIVSLASGDRWRSGKDACGSIGFRWTAAEPLYPPSALAGPVHLGISDSVRSRAPERDLADFPKRLHEDFEGSSWRYALSGGPAAEALQHFYRDSELPLFVAGDGAELRHRLRWLADRSGPISSLPPKVSPCQRYAASGSLRTAGAWRGSLGPSNSAARSLGEGMEETLTVHRLHVPMKLRKTIASTNVIESAFSIVEQVCRNVKRWHGSDHRERWVGSGLVVAEKQFRRVQGYKQIPALIKELEASAPSKSVVVKQRRAS
jgi:hypothetical protein